MAATRTARTPSQLPRPVSLQQQQAQAHLIRVGMFAALLVMFAVPLLPSPIAGVDWWAYVWPQIGPVLIAPFPPPEIGMPIPSRPTLLWAIWALVAGGVYLCWALVLHVMLLYRQRTCPLQQQRTYLRLRTPLELTLNVTDGLSLLRTLHGVLPRSGMGNGAPLVLRWTGRPEQAATQGVSLLGAPTLTTSVQKMLEGLGNGTQADGDTDPLLGACQTGRVLCWADVRLAAPSDLPIASATGTQTPLVDALLSSLAPQKGVFTSDVQLIVSPIGDRLWRLPVLARLEASKGDAGSIERKALEQKAAGPAFEVCIRLIAVADSPTSGAAMVQTVGATLASSAQAVGAMEQRLLAGPVQCLPAVMAAPKPLAARTRLMLAVTGLLVGLLTLGGLLLTSHATHAPQLWALPVLLGLLPATLISARHFRRQGGRQWQQLCTVLNSVPPPRNPQVIPLWADWFSHLK